MATSFARVTAQQAFSGLRWREHVAKTAHSKINKMKMNEEKERQKKKEQTNKLVAVHSVVAGRISDYIVNTARCLGTQNGLTPIYCYCDYYYRIERRRMMGELSEPQAANRQLHLTNRKNKKNRMLTDQPNVCLRTKSPGHFIDDSFLRTA